ncbi:MAG: hypothetical protein V3U55_07920, partial [Mycobacterium sp.]
TALLGRVLVMMLDIAAPPIVWNACARQAPKGRSQSAARRKGALLSSCNNNNPRRGTGRLRGAW